MEKKKIRELREKRDYKQFYLNNFFTVKIEMQIVKL